MDENAGKIAVLAWLAGLTDGDGSIGVHKQPNNGGGQLVPQFSIVTTCEVTYRRLAVVLSEIGVGCYWTHRTPSHRNKMPMWVLKVVGMKRCKNLLEQLLPYFVTKKREAELILRFIDERFSYPMRRGYTPEQLAIVEEVHRLKLTRNNSTPWRELKHSAAKSSETSTPEVA